jgi:peptidoglycan L-alanyl-D-glutamate endopeptidase CwlK
MPTLNNRSKKNLLNIHPNLVNLIEKAIINSPVDYTVTSGIRTEDEQRSLYLIGRRGIKDELRVTDKDGVFKKSNHQIKDDGYGHAIDIYPFFDGKVHVSGPTVAPKLTEIANHIKRVASNLGYKVIWGGDWKMVDMPHFEIKL